MGGLEQLRRSARRGSSAALCGALLACATPVNYYAMPAPVLPQLDERYREVLIDAFATAASKSRLHSIELVEGGQHETVTLVEGRAAELASFPVDALSAAVLAATDEARGAEYDIMVRAAPDAAGRIVTVRHDLDGRLVVLLGSAPAALVEPAPSSEELQARFQIGPLLDGAAPWSENDRRALATALALLSPSELVYLRHLPFRRDRQGRSDSHAGYYTSSEPDFGGGLIVLLDVAFRSDGNVFVGSPERAYPQSILVILHEIGHAIAKLDREKLVVAYERDSKKYDELVDIYDDYVKVLAAHDYILTRVRPSERRKTLQTLREIEESQRKLQVILRNASRRLREMVRSIQSPSPIEIAYSALEGATRGPTVYGSTSPEEGFAEAFALYHLDPDSVRRFSSAVHDWFAATGHLSSAQFPPLEDVGPPPVLSVSSGPEASPP